jgi:hypothetical protein
LRIFLYPPAGDIFYGGCCGVDKGFSKGYNKYIVTDCRVWAKSLSCRGCEKNSAPKASSGSVAKENLPQRTLRVHRVYIRTHHFFLHRHILRKK